MEGRTWQAGSLSISLSFPKTTRTLPHWLLSHLLLVTRRKTCRWETHWSQLKQRGSELAELLFLRKFFSNSSPHLHFLASNLFQVLVWILLNVFLTPSRPWPKARLLRALCRQEPLLLSAAPDSNVSGCLYSAENAAGKFRREDPLLHKNNTF